MHHAKAIQNRKGVSKEKAAARLTQLLAVGEADIVAGRVQDLDEVLRELRGDRKPRTGVALAANNDLNADILSGLI